MSLTTEQIHALTPGPETDALVATEVMGWVKRKLTCTIFDEYDQWYWVEIVNEEIVVKYPVDEYNPTVWYGAQELYGAMATVDKGDRQWYCNILVDLVGGSYYLPPSKVTLLIAFATPLQQCKALLLLAMEKEQS